MTAACIGEPVSWLRLEQLALGELADAGAARAHLDACPACAAALARITGDVRPLPRLPLLAVAVPAPWWRRWQLAGAGLAVAMAAALLVLLVRNPDEPALGPRTVRVKGAGPVVIGLVRERGGAIAFDPPDVAPGDRWKVEVTCAPGGAAWVDVVVHQDGAASFPLAARRLRCGNRVAVPGAFRITGGAAEVCVAVAASAPDRTRLAAGERRGTSCTRLTPP